MQIKYQRHLLCFIPLVFSVFIFFNFWNRPLTAKDDNDAFRKLRVLVKEQPQQNYYVVRWRSNDGNWSSRKYSGWSYVEYDRSQHLLKKTFYRFKPKYWFSSKFPYLHKMGYSFNSGTCADFDELSGSNVFDHNILQSDSTNGALGSAGNHVPEACYEMTS